MVNLWHFESMLRMNVRFQAYSYKVELINDETVAQFYIITEKYNGNTWPQLIFQVSLARSTMIFIEHHFPSSTAAKRSGSQRLLKLF